MNFLLCPSLEFIASRLPPPFPVGRRFFYQTYIDIKRLAVFGIEQAFVIRTVPDIGVWMP